MLLVAGKFISTNGIWRYRYGIKEDLERERRLELETQNRNKYYEEIIKQVPYFKDMLIRLGSESDYERAYKEGVAVANVAV